MCTAVWYHVLAWVLHKNQPGIMSLFSSNKCNPWATLQYWLILQALLSIVSNHLAWCSSALSRTFCTVTRENQIRETVPGTFALHCGSHYLYFFIAHKISLASACKALASGNESLLHRVVPSLQMRSIQVTMEWWSSWKSMNKGKSMWNQFFRCRSDILIILMHQISVTLSLLGNHLGLIACTSL